MMRLFFIGRQPAIVAILCALASCNTGTFDPGGDFIQSETYTERTDTVSIVLSTFRFDSVATSGTKLACVGAYPISVLGRQHSVSFSKLALPSPITWNNKEIYDSVCLQLRHSGLVWGDSLAPFTVRVHTASEKWSTGNDGKIYNTRATGIHSTAIGTYTYLPYVNVRKQIRYRLDDGFGQELFEFIRSNYSSSEMSDLWEQYFYGLHLSGSENSQAMVGYAASDSSLQVTLYSHTPDIEKRVVKRSFVCDQSEKQYNQTRLEGVSEPFASILAYRDVLTERQTEGIALMHEASGHYLRIDFPYLNELLYANQNGHVVKAELRLIPAKGHNERKLLPPSLYLSEIRQANVWGSGVTNGSEQVAAQLVVDPTTDEGTYYAMDVTYYLNTRLTESVVNLHNGLTLTLGASSDSGNFSSLILGGRTHLWSRSKLILYYYYYDKN